MAVKYLHHFHACVLVVNQNIDIHYLQRQGIGIGFTAGRRDQDTGLCGTMTVTKA